MNKSSAGNANRGNVCTHNRLSRGLADNKWNERRSLRDTLDSLNIPVFSLRNTGPPLPPTLPHPPVSAIPRREFKARTLGTRPNKFPPLSPAIRANLAGRRLTEIPAAQSPSFVSIKIQTGINPAPLLDCRPFPGEIASEIVQPHGTLESPESRGQNVI